MRGGHLLQDGGHTRVEDPSRLGGGISFMFCGSRYTGTVAAFVPSLIPCLTCPDLSYTGLILMV